MNRQRSPATALRARPAFWQRHRFIELLTAMGVALAALVAFLPVKNAALVNYDDYGNVVVNPYFSPLTVRNVAQLWRVPYFATYAPVTYTFFAFERWLSDPAQPDPNSLPVNARALHLGNLALHAAGAGLVFVLLSRLTGNRAASACGGLIFALHPVQAEPVGWVTETKTLLAGVFALVALWQYVCFVQQRQLALGGCKKGALSCRVSPYYLAATIAFVLAILAKPSAAAVPLMALALDTLWLGRSWKWSLWAVGPWFLIAIALAIITRKLQAAESSAAVALWARPLVAGDAVAFYLAKLVAPVRLATDYGRNPAYVLSHWWGYVTWLAPATLLALLAWRKVDWHYWAALAISVAAWAPVSGLIPFGFQDISTVADRYLHLPLVGVALAIAWFLTKHASRLNFRIAIALALVLGVWSWRQVQTWHDDETLARAGLAVNRRSELLRQILGSGLLDKRQYGAALAAYREAAELNPRSARAQVKWASALEKVGRAEEALAHFEWAARLKPDSADAQRLLAYALAQRGRTAEAIAHYRLALEHNPTPRVVHIELADALSKAGHFGEAVAHYRAALAWHHEDFRTWLSLAESLQQSGDPTQAVTAFREAIRIRPAEAVAHLECGMALARLGRTDEAIESLRHAVQASPRLAVAHQNLAALLASVGRNDEAMEHLRRALALLPDNPDAHYSLGVLLSRKAKNEEAIEHLRTAIAARPEWIDPRAMLADALDKAGRPKEAIAVYRDALRVADKRPDLHRGLGTLLARLGQKREAIEHLSTALRLDPDDREARAALEAEGITEVPGMYGPASGKRDG